MEKGRSPKTAAKLAHNVLHYRTAQFATEGISAPLFHPLTPGHTAAWYRLSCCDRSQISAPHALRYINPPGLLVTYIPGYSTLFPSFRCAGMEQPHAAVQTGRQLAWEQLCRKGPGILVDTKWTQVCSAHFPTSYWAVARPKLAGQGRNPSPCCHTGIATDGKLWPVLGFQTQCRHWQTRLSPTEDHQGCWGLKHTM